MPDQTPTNNDPKADRAPLQQPNNRVAMIRTLAFKELHQRLLDDCPRFAGDQQIRAETQQMIDAMPTEPLPLAEPAPGPASVEDWIDRGIAGMARMANEDAERLKMARRLF